MKIEVRKITTADCKEWARTDRKTVSPTRYNTTVFGASVLFENIHARDNTSIGNRPLFFNGITANGLRDWNTAIGVGARVSNTDGVGRRRDCA